MLEIQTIGGNKEGRDKRRGLRETTPDTVGSPSRVEVQVQNETLTNRRADTMAQGVKGMKSSQDGNRSQSGRAWGPGKCEGIREVGQEETGGGVRG